jgi:hypothetical protein
LLQVVGEAIRQLREEDEKPNTQMSSQAEEVLTWYFSGIA